MKLKRILIVAASALMAVTMAAQTEFEVPVWEGKAPTKSGDAADQAMMKVYLPDITKANGRAIVICPGGGYENLAMQHEGTDWAPFFNRMGIAAIVLKYRMPHGHAQVPIEDAEQTMRIVRANAHNWNIKADQVGIMGSSAGGHLASTLATHSTGDAKPNFQILFYPVISMQPGYTHQGSHDNLLGKNAKKKQEQLYSNETQVSRTTPRACIILAFDDDCVLPINSLQYVEQLYKHDVPATMFMYPSGGHGFGMTSTWDYHVEMLLNLRAWLESF